MPTERPSRAGSQGNPVDALVAVLEDPEFGGTALLQIELSAPSSPVAPSLTGSGTEQFQGDDWRRLIDAPRMATADGHTETLHLADQTLDLTDGIWIIRDSEEPSIGLRGLLRAVAGDLRPSPAGQTNQVVTASASVSPNLAVSFLDRLGPVVQVESADASVEVQISGDGAPMSLKMTVGWGRRASATAPPTYQLTLTADVDLGAAPDLARPQSVWRTWASPTLGYEMAVPVSWEAEPARDILPSDRFTAPDVLLAVVREQEWPAYDGMVAWEPRVEAQFTADGAWHVEERSTYDGTGSGEKQAWFRFHGETDGEARHFVVGLETIGYEAWEVALAAAPGHEADDLVLVQQLLGTFSPRVNDATWVGTLDPGACFDPVSNWIMPESRGHFWSDGDVPARSYACTEPHWFEVVGTISAPVGRSADVACGPAFTSYVGRSPDASALSIAVIGNQQAPRTGVDYLCVVSDPTGPLTASVKGQDR
jgi:hypothetical protein